MSSAPSPRDAAIEAWHVEATAVDMSPSPDVPGELFEVRRAVIEQAVAMMHSLLQRLEAAYATNREWIKANGPGGWIDNLRLRSAPPGDARLREALTKARCDYVRGHPPSCSMITHPDETPPRTLCDCGTVALQDEIDAALASPSPAPSAWASDAEVEAAIKEHNKAIAKLVDAAAAWGLCCNSPQTRALYAARDELSAVFARALLRRPAGQQGEAGALVAAVQELLAADRQCSCYERCECREPALDKLRDWRNKHNAAPPSALEAT